MSERLAPPSAAMLLLGASVAVALGSVWDVSWDASIGRHSLWSPPHLLINHGAAVAFIAAWMRWRNAHRIERGIIGIAGLGAVALIVAEAVTLTRPATPGDLGEDSFIPMLGAGGALAITAGAWLSCEMAMRSRWLLRAVAAGMALVVVATALGAYSLPNLQRTALFLQIAAAAYPAWLVVAAGGAGRWPATQAALVYSASIALLAWVLPLFPAVPAVEPVHEPVTHMLPPRFPLLLVLPALACDVVSQRMSRWGWRAVPIFAAVYLAVFVPAQWFFAAFLLDPASDNWFFVGGGQHWPFYVEIGAERSLFWGAEQSPVDLIAGMTVVVIALLSAAAGVLLHRGIAAVHRIRFDPSPPAPR